MVEAIGLRVQVCNLFQRNSKAQCTKLTVLLTLRVCPLRVPKMFKLIFKIVVYLSYTMYIKICIVQIVGFRLNKLNSEKCKQNFKYSRIG